MIQTVRSFALKLNSLAINKENFIKEKIDRLPDTEDRQANTEQRPPSATAIHRAQFNAQIENALVERTVIWCERRTAHDFFNRNMITIGLSNHKNRKHFLVSRLVVNPEVKTCTERLNYLTPSPLLQKLQIHCTFRGLTCSFIFFINWYAIHIPHYPSSLSFNAGIHILF